MSKRLSLQEFEAYIDKYIGFSSSMSFDEKRAMWDLQESHPMLAPEEKENPLIGWPAIEEYWRETRESIESLSTEWWDLHVQQLSSDFVLLHFKQRWSAIMRQSSVFPGQQLASTVRVTMAMRRRTGDWRIIFSVESHVDGVAYFRALYAQRALRD